jgi:hypothetical protein
MLFRALSTRVRLVSSLLAATTLTLAGAALAEAEFDVSVAGTKIEVKAKAGWHINKDYPWKLVMGDTKLDKSKFTLGDGAATITAPKGTYKLKGGVCSEGQCLMIDKQVTVL